MYTPAVSFYNYWKHTYLEREQFLAGYGHETLNIMPYWRDDWYFGFKSCELRPHAPIISLLEWAQKRNRSISFFIPLTPCPAIPEGGLPFKERIPALDYQGLSLSIVQEDKSLNHIHSAFEKSTAQQFYIWIKALKNLVEQYDVSVFWWGISSYFPQGTRFHSFLEDRSHAFEQAFARYVQSNGLELQGDLIQEYDRFQNLFSEYYRASFLDVFDAQETQLKDVCFMKGSPDHIFWQQLSSEDDLGDVSLDFCRSYTYGMTPDFSLVHKKRFSPEIWNFFQTISPLETDFRDMYMDNMRVKFSALHLFKIWGEGSLRFIEEKANELKLTTFFFNFFRWKYLLNQQQEFLPQDLDKITFCLHENLTQKNLEKIAQAFSRGHRVIVFQESLSVKQWRFWNNFVEQNHYFKEDIVYQGNVKYFSNTQGGKIIFLSRIALTRLGVNATVEFWEKIVEFFDLDALKIQHSQGVNYFWQLRDVRSHELSYSQVRRVFIHNTTNQPKRAQIKLLPESSLIKVSDRVRAKVSTDDNDVWIELGSMGMTTIEFGIIE